jgi:rhamnosyltransferase
MTTATAVVLYHPTVEMIQTIRGYAEFSEFLIVVDNTEHTDYSAEFRGIAGITYVTLGANKGLATALNVAAKLAIANGYGWMMMLDQDTVLSRLVYDSLRKQISEIEHPRVGLVTPLQVSKEEDLRAAERLPDRRDLLQAMTSGSVLSLEAYVNCGHFEDKLFIDHVDNEYCLRLRRAGYRVIQLTRVVLDHALGEVKEATIFGRRFRFITHRPFRSYYFVRNGCYVAVKFIGSCPQFLGLLFINITKGLLKAIFFEDEKLVRLRMMLRGFSDFCRGRYGPARFL